MRTLGYSLIFVALWLIQRVATGNATTVIDDTADAFAAVATNRYDDLRAVVGRVPEGVPAKSVGTLPKPSPDTAASGGSLLGMMRQLGEGRPYRWGATGPNSYDCSGLVWRSMQKLGIYTGPRFTTSTFGAAMRASGLATRVDDPAPGDVVVWPSSHMGVLVGGDVMYAARSARTGIGTQSIAGLSRTRGVPQYWRVGLA